MIAAGNIRVPAAYTGQLTCSGLPFTPTRILFRTATPSTTDPANISYGLWSRDHVEAPNFPQQSAVGTYSADGNSSTLAQSGIIARIDIFGVSEQALVVQLIDATDNAFVVEVTANDLTADAWIHWVATP